MSKRDPRRKLVYEKVLSGSSTDERLRGHPMPCESRTHSDILSGDIPPYVTIHGFHARGIAGRETGGPYLMSLNERLRGSTLEDDGPMRYGAAGEVSSLGDGGDEWRENLGCPLGIC